MPYYLSNSRYNHDKISSQRRPDNRGMTSNISSATNPLGFSDGHEVLERAMEGVPALRTQEALRLDLPEAMPSIMSYHRLLHKSHCQIAAISEPSFNTGSQVEGQLLQVVNISLQE